MWGSNDYSQIASSFQLSVIRPKPNQLLPILLVRLLSQSQTVVEPKPKHT